MSNMLCPNFNFNFCPVKKSKFSENLGRRTKFWCEDIFVALNCFIFIENISSLKVNKISS